jgi:hypothetical protein
LNRVNRLVDFDPGLVGDFVSRHGRREEPHQPPGQQERGHGDAGGRTAEPVAVQGAQRPVEFRWHGRKCSKELGHPASTCLLIMHAHKIDTSLDSDRNKGTEDSVG